MIPRSPPARLLAGSTLLAWLAACGGGDDRIAPEPPPTVPVVAVIDLTVANLEPTVGTAVAVTAHARTASGAPVEGVRVDFTTGPSSGSVSPAFSTTNADGAAFTTWTVATVAGRQTILARSGAFSDTMSVAVVPGPPASAIADGDTEHVANSGDMLSVAVVVRDEYGNPVPTVPVVFDVVAGGGSVSPGSAGTDSSGRASTVWTLGPEPGENRLAARAGDLEAVIFTASTRQFVDLTVANLEPTVGTAVAVTAHVRTASDAPVEGVRVDFTTGPSSGSVSPAFSTTNADGAAFTTWTVATVAGRQTLSARSGVFSDTTSVAVAPGPPASATPEGTTERVATSREVLSVAVVVHDQYGNPVPTVPVVFEVVAGGGSVSPGRAETDSGGRASSVWTLGLVLGENRLAARAGDLEAVIFTTTTRQLAIEESVQDQWPESDEITLRGSWLNLMSAATVLVDGAPPASIVVVDSTQAVIRQRPLSGARAEGCALSRTGQLTVGAPGVAFSAEVARWHGPLTTLEVGQELRFDSNQHCLRLGGESAAGAQYVLAAVDRSYIDAARLVSEEWHYNGGTPFDLSLADSTDGASATAGLLARIQPPAPDPLARRPDHVHVHPPTTFQQSDDVWSRTVPYRVGDEFEWYTANDRKGTFQVMALYPPNVVLAVFKEDLPVLWDDRRALAMDSLFQHLGSPEVQELYRTAFGDGPAQSNDVTGQMLVMFHDGGDGDLTGINLPATNFRESTVHFRRFSYQDDNSWYYGLVAHELAHAWQQKAIGRVSAVWSGEGIANWFADERLRLWAGLGLDANHDAYVAIQGWYLRLPYTGDFVAGYRESHSFLRFLVSRLVLDYGQSYASAARRVVWGAAEGWHGRHFTNWDVVGRGEGLVRRMRQVVPDWDPVEARLDWMVSIALDDRSSLPGYRIPFVREAFQYFGPSSASFRLGDGYSAAGELAGGGNYYFMVQDEGALHISVPAESTSEDGPAIAWKLVRWK